MKWKIVHAVALIFNFLILCHLGYNAYTVEYWISGACITVSWIAGRISAADEILKRLERENGKYN